METRAMMKEEETCGKYATKREAVFAAKMETQRTGFKHTAVFTAYRSIQDNTKITCWTVVLQKKTGRM